ncbi:MAG TPA: hypothetical protein VJK02_19460 [Anaerolineales bacterium]|nr:hypothetical protein [Anaerolineales bacterium]
MNEPGIIKESRRPRADLLALVAGIVFSLAFTAIIALAGPRLAEIPHLPDQGAAWYYWRLIQPTFQSRASAWGLYALHQLALWGLIYFAQTRVKRYTVGLHPVNVVALGINALFIALHFVQTHVWYDGLAQDVSIFSSQGAVVLLLVWVLLMENNRRGLFFGKKLPISAQITRFARKYHGYLFAWAIVYTFWYHPMESSAGHLVGFAYMFLLLLQGSLFFTRIHTNRWWTMGQELMVLAHGSLVAAVQGNGLWPMFAFGFGGIFVITQMHGVGLRLWHKATLLAFYISATLFVYSDRGWENLNEVVRIPAIEYLAVIVLAGLLGVGLWLGRCLLRSSAGSDEAALVG